MLSLKIDGFTHAKQAVVLVSELRGAVALQVNSTNNGIDTYKYTAAEWKTEADKGLNNILNAEMIADTPALPSTYVGFLTMYTAETSAPYTLTQFAPSSADDLVAVATTGPTTAGDTISMDGFPRFGTEEKQWIASVDPEGAPTALLNLVEWKITSDVVAGGSMALLAAACTACATLLAF